MAGSASTKSPYVRNDVAWILTIEIDWLRLGEILHLQSQGLARHVRAGPFCVAYTSFIQELKKIKWMLPEFRYLSHRRNAMKVKYIIDKRAPDSKKKDLLVKVMKELSGKVSINGDQIECEQSYEGKVVNLLTHSGVKYEKAA